MHQGVGEENPGAKLCKACSSRLTAVLSEMHDVNLSTYRCKAV